MSLSLTENQRLAITVTERINSGLSLVGIFFILTTFMFSSSFNKPINRLIFFASWGNIGSNVAGLISETGLTGSMALCQAQAFLVQMFLGVDCCWAICMAINVYLIFFRGYTIEQLRPLDVRYLVACYGLSFIPAIVFCFISTKDLGQLYGPALIWCWISPKWDWVRLVALYSVAWVAIIIASVVYIMAGRVIWSKRKYLDGFLNPLNENPFTSIVTTEIEITHEDRSILKDTESHGMSDLPSNIDPYSVTVRVETPCREPTLPPALRIRSLTRNAAKSEPNAEAWLYARVAVLFFIALLITWVPTSVNRVYALAHPNVINFPLNYVSSFVFPLQGFWNTVVYIITSQTACRKLWDQIVYGKRGSGKDMGSRSSESFRRLTPGGG